MTAPPRSHARATTVCTIAGRLWTHASAAPLGAAASVGACLLATVPPALAHPHVWVATDTSILFRDGAVSGIRYTWMFDEMYTASASEGLDKNNDGKLDAGELEELLKVNIDGLKEFDYFTQLTSQGKPLQLGAASDYGMEIRQVDEPPGPQMLLPPDSPQQAGATPAAAPEDKAARQQLPPPGLWQRVTGWLAGLIGSKPSATAQAPAAAPPAPSASAPVAPGEKAKVLTLTLTLPLTSPVPSTALGEDGKGFQLLLSDPQMFIAFEPAGKDAVRLGPDAPAGCRFALVQPEMDEEQKKLAEAFGQVGALAIAGPRAVAVICGK